MLFSGLAAHVQRHDDVHDGQRLREERPAELHHGPQGLGLQNAGRQCEQGGQHEVEGAGALKENNGRTAEDHGIVE